MSSTRDPSIRLRIRVVGSVQPLGACHTFSHVKSSAQPTERPPACKHNAGSKIARQAPGHELEDARLEKDIPATSRGMGALQWLPRHLPLQGGAETAVKAGAMCKGALVPEQCCAEFLEQGR